MTAWLHFVGRSYYATEAAFIREAKQYGVSRRISLRLLKAFRFGDVVLLAMWDGHSAVVFGEFTVEVVSGFDSFFTAELRARGLIREKVSSGGTFIKRGCGSYYTGSTYTVSCDIDKLAEIAEAREKAGAPTVQPMISGPFRERERVRINIAFSRGFRRFNLEEFEEAVRAAKLKAEAQGRKLRVMKVDGVFLGEREAALLSGEGAVQEVRDYIKIGGEQSESTK